MSSKAKGLGKGLDVLLGGDLESPGKEHESDTAYTELRIDKIDPNPSQPRKSFAEDNLHELAQSIKNQGVLQPILVRSHPGEKTRYQIIAGERRWRAAQLAGVSMIPVRIVDCSDQELILVGLIENIHRQDLNPVEEAMAYKVLLKELNLTQSELAEKIGKSRSAIANATRLLLLEDEIIAALKDNLITVGHARTLLGFPDGEIRCTVFKKIVEKKLSVREVEQILTYWRKNSKLPAMLSGRRNKQPAGEIDELHQGIVNSLSERFGLKCMVKGDPTKGKIILSYNSRDQFDSLLKIFQIEE